MQEALKEAKAAALEGEVPVGAVMVYGNECIAGAHNHREQDNDPTAHAEMLVFRASAKKLGRRRLTGCTLYVTLEPCPMCAGAAVMAGVDRIVFGAFDEAKGCAGSIYSIPEDPAFSTGILCDGGIEEHECTQVLQQFFENRRKNNNTYHNI